MKAILLLVAFLGLVASFSPHRLQTKAIRRSRQCVTQVKLASTDAPKPSKAPVKKWSKDTKSGSGSSGSDNRASVENFVTVPHDRWLQGSIQSVSNFGIFVRPAGSDAVGLVHQSRIPRSLIAALKTQVPPPAAGSEKSDVERLFNKGDVVKVRVGSVDVDSKKLELSMLPYKESEDEEDDYIVEGRDTEDQEQEDFNDAADDDDQIFDGESLLVWWKGSPYKAVGNKETDAVAVDEETQVLGESDQVIAGSMRRMFEIDLRQDEADQSSKMFEAEMKELEEEIGELNGLDEDIVDYSLGSVGYKGALKVGSSVSWSVFPPQMKQDMEYFKDISVTSTKVREKKEESIAELEAIVREIEGTMKIPPKMETEPANATPAVAEESAPAV